MFSFLLIGATLAFSAAVEPGPFQAYFVSSTMANGWRRTLPAVFAPILSDLPIACLILIVLTHVSRMALDVLRLAGGLFLLYLAGQSLAAFRRYEVRESGDAGGARRTFFEAVGVNLLNPNPYISWSLILGPLLIQAWNESAAHAVALIAAFYLTFVGVTGMLLVLLAGVRSAGPRVGRSLVGLSALALGVFGVYQVWTGATSLVGRPAP